MALTVLITYDISADHTRAQVAAYLQQWGDRIQRSVFVCAIAPDDLDQVNTALATMITPTPTPSSCSRSMPPAGRSCRFTARPNATPTSPTGRYSDRTMNRAVTPSRGRVPTKIHNSSLVQPT